MSFTPNSKGPKQAALMEVDEGTFNKGTWVPGRWLNGDETSGGLSLNFRGSTPTLQKVKLYRHD